VTLVELMVTVSIMVTLLVIAVPGFQHVVMLSKIRSYADDLSVASMLARSEALKRNQTVKLCSSTNGTSCSGSGTAWSGGWIIIDESVPTVIQSHAAVASKFRVRESGAQASLSFPPSGVGVTTASFTVCRWDPVGSEERVVDISASGRALVRKTTAASCPAP
jgi:type IV fimbrial biogenesis protein FimT